MNFEKDEQLERTVACWLLVTSNWYRSQGVEVPYNGHQETVAEAEELQSCSPNHVAWRSEKCHTGKVGRLERREIPGRAQNFAFWQTVHDAPEFDLLFDLREVPSGSLLGDLLRRRLERNTALVEPKLVEKVFKQGYVQVEVKATYHSHYDEQRAHYDELPLEFETSSGKPTGWSLSTADLAVFAVRNFCDKASCELAFCQENRKAAENVKDIRQRFSYYVLAVPSLKRLLCDTRYIFEEVRESRKNAIRSGYVKLKLVRFYTLLREATAKHTARMLEKEVDTVS